MRTVGLDLTQVNSWSNSEILTGDAPINVKPWGQGVVDGVQTQGNLTFSWKPALGQIARHPQAPTECQIPTPRVTL